MPPKARKSAAKQASVDSTPNDATATTTTAKTTKSAAKSTAKSTTKSTATSSATKAAPKSTAKTANAKSTNAKSTNSKSKNAKSTIAKSDAKSNAVSNVPESIDIYIRMQEDPNKDYCFNVPTSEPVSWLFSIFDTIPILLNPSYFFDTKPEGFAISVHPGYLTAEGGILFSDKAHHEQWIKKVSLDALIGDVFTEGQLIVPVWHHRSDREFKVLVALLTWLYLDLPEFISPTPGTAPSRLIYWLSQIFFEPPRVNDESSSLFTNHWVQIGFFVMHILKVSFIYLVLWNGLWHPATLNPFSSPRARTAGKKMPDVNKMNDIGWTGSRRCGLFEWSERYMNIVTDRAGGVLEAHRQGLFVKPVGLFLREDEGWNVLKNKKLDEVEVEDDLLDSDGKFVVSRPYFEEIAKPLTRYLRNPETTDAEGLAMLKEFRETGGLLGTDFIREFFSDMVEHDEHEYGGVHVDQVGKK